MIAAVGSNSQVLWYLSRGTGLVSLVLLTATLVLGIAEVARYARPGWPQFVVAALHRNVSLLAVLFVAVHVATSVLDTFVSISVVDVFVPFVGSYRPVWLGLGTVAFDLMVAVAATSAIRARLGYRAWRMVHLSAYACWPIALAHGLGIGTDTALGWVVLINGSCFVAIVAGVVWRAGHIDRVEPPSLRPAAAASHRAR